MSDVETTGKAAPDAPATDTESAESTTFLQSMIIERFRWAYYLAWVFVAGMLILMLWQASQSTPATDNLMSIQGKVTKAEEVQEAPPGGGNAVTVPYLTFEYDADPDKALSPQTLTWAVSPEYFAAHPVDSLITIYLDPAQPDQIILEPPSNTANVTRILLGGTVLLVLVTIRLGLDIYARRRYP